MINKKILLLAHDGEDLYKARMPFARYLINRGYRVFAIVPHDNYSDLIQKEGIDVKHLSIERDNKNPVNLLKSMFEVRKYALENDIDIVHSFKFVPNLINSFSNLLTNKKVVLHIAGLGIAFANDGPRYKILKFIQQILFFIQFLRANLIIIQNPDDFNDFLFKNNFRNKIKLIKGSGVNVIKFTPNLSKLANNKAIFLCTTRLIWEKGIREMVHAFEALPEKYKDNIELKIIGEPDDKNPRSVTSKFIKEYKSSRLIQFLGQQENIQEHLQNSDVFILPSYYREGIPRSILEALACGLPIITTNVPGCNLTILPDQNGLLIEPRSVEEISIAVKKMLMAKSEWTRMGSASRYLALSEFSEEKIFSEIVKLYNI
jgi:glycosyltransferase involved in cell wall biosynthesis